jgi:hypothetical protein
MTLAPRLALAGPSTFLFALALALTACSKTDTAPVPEHNDVATSMPDAASTPGAQGPAVAPPHPTTQGTAPGDSTASSPPAPGDGAAPR